MGGPYRCGVCRNELDEFQIVPHLKIEHPGVADDLEQWPDGSVVNGLIEDEDIFVPEAWS